MCVSNFLQLWRTFTGSCWTLFCTRIRIQRLIGLQSSTYQVCIAVKSRSLGRFLLLPPTSINTNVLATEFRSSVPSKRLKTRFPSYGD
ncbi:hypothetical protein ACHAXN_000025 [Cyclotella atomus]